MNKQKLHCDGQLDGFVGQLLAFETRQSECDPLHLSKMSTVIHAYTARLG